MSAPAPSMFSPAAKAMAEKLGLKMGRANLEEFAPTLEELAKADPNIVAVTSDSRGSGKLAPFGKALPKQIVEVGIAEQNLVGITAGLAACGKQAFGVSPSCFLTARALEQIKNDVCYSDVPADNFEARQAIVAAARLAKPGFIRFGKAAMYNLHPPETRFEVGQAIPVREGTDVAFIPTGETVVHALLAAAQLAGRGIQARVLSRHTVKPLDTEAILKAGFECRAVVTVEEHMIHGGLGEACAAVLMQAGMTRPFRIVGIPDEETVTGAQADICRHYGISMEGLSALVVSLL